jgi:hypothetical protein
MKRLFALAAIVFLAATGWSLGQKLSADALSMGIGIFFGILASIPAALLVLAAARRGERMPAPDRRQPAGLGPGGYQTPVIVVAPPMAGYGPMPGQMGQQPPIQGQLPPSQMIVDSSAQRQFRVIGEDDDWVDEY